MPKLIKQALLPLLIVFHLIGGVGMVFFDLEQFASLSMYNLLFSCFLLFLGQAKGVKNLFKLFIPVFLLGYFIEVVGVKTGYPFGSYMYGNALGVKLFEVPLIIGINWFMLVIGAGYMVKSLSKAFWIRIVLAASIMVLVDYPIEHMAATLDYWYWENDTIPARNFIGWFVIALIMQWLFNRIMIGSENKIAPWYIIVVTVFFIVLNICL